MTRSIRRTLAAILVTITAVACSQLNPHPVGITRSETLVAGCQKLGDVSVAPRTADGDVVSALTDQARAKGADYVLVPSDGARSGAAYRCQSPSVATR
jgi:hypothetical protein